MLQHAGSPIGPVGLRAAEVAVYAVLILGTLLIGHSARADGFIAVRCVALEVGGAFATRKQILSEGRGVTTFGIEHFALKL